MSQVQANVIRTRSSEPCATIDLQHNCRDVSWRRYPSRRIWNTYHFNGSQMQPSKEFLHNLRSQAVFHNPSWVLCSTAVCQSASLRVWVGHTSVLHPSASSKPIDGNATCSTRFLYDRCKVWVGAPDLGGGVTLTWPACCSLIRNPVSRVDRRGKDCTLSHTSLIRVRNHSVVA